MYMKDIRCDVYWFYLPRHMDRLRDFVIKLMNLRISYSVKNLLVTDELLDNQDGIHLWNE
jgi:hypothetical protein